MLIFEHSQPGRCNPSQAPLNKAEVKDIPHTGPGDLMNGLIEHWTSYRPRLEAAVAKYLAMENVPESSDVSSARPQRE